MKRNVLVYSILVLLFAALAIANISLGSIAVPMKEIWAILGGHIKDTTYATIILNIRLPRIVAACLLGGGLALSGYMLQTFFHNPIAGPFVLGISSGAKLMVALLMVFSVRLGFYANSVSMIFAALIGSLIVTVFVLLASSRVKQMSVLIVCGVMVGYICSAITELVISLADDANIVNLHNWAMGSFSAMDWKAAGCFTPIILLGLLCAIFMAKQMEAYSFGENYAKSLGVSVKLFRIILIMISSILSATVTAFAGPISFVGIAVPHIMRQVLKSDRPVLIIPAAFLGGGVFCLFSDLLARCLLSPRELSISTMTAIFGAPVVIVMLMQRRVK